MGKVPFLLKLLQSKYHCVPVMGEEVGTGWTVLRLVGSGGGSRQAVLAGRQSSTHPRARHPSLCCGEGEGFISSSEQLYEAGTAITIL